MDHPRSVENSSAESNVDYQGPAHEVSEGPNLSNLAREHSYNTDKEIDLHFVLVLRIWRLN